MNGNKQKNLSLGEYINEILLYFKLQLNNNIVLMINKKITFEFISSKDTRKERDIIKILIIKQD